MKLRAAAAHLASALSRAFAALRRIASRRRPVTPGPTQDVRALAAFDPASAPIESIYQHAVTSSARIMGLTGVSPASGVSSLAQTIARRASSGGQRTLLIDVSSPDLAGSAERTPQPAPDGWSRLELRPTPDERLPLREVARLRRLFTSYAEEFDFILVDMPSVNGGAEHPLPATIVANACDATTLVCLTGQNTHVELQQALRTLAGANVKPCGIIVNHREQPTLGAEIAREAERMRRFAPRMADRIQRRMARSKFLNIHA